MKERDLTKELGVLEKKNETLTKKLTESLDNKKNALRRANAAERSFRNYKKYIQGVSKWFARTSLPTKEQRALARRLFGALANGDKTLTDGIMRNHEVVGFCRNCKINLYGPRGSEAPAAITMACGVAACPFEEPVARNRRGIAV